MSTELEHRVRESLSRQAGAATPGHPDPFARFSALERRHRTTRRIRQVVVAGGCAGLLAAVGFGVVPLPSVIPAISVTPADGGSVLDQPTRGSLAADTAWQDGLRRHVTDQRDDDGNWRVVNRKGIKVLFAGDVAGRRLALVTVTLRLGVLEDHSFQWYEGPAGADPAQMDEGSNGDPTDVAAVLSGDDTAPGHLVVVAPPGAQIETSLSVGFGADGRLERTWTRAPGTDGLALLTVAPSTRVPSAAVRVSQGGRSLFDGPPDVGWSSEVTPKPESPKVVRKALDGARGSTMQLAWAVQLVQQSLDEAGLVPATTAVRIPWTGTVHGQPALLVELTPQGGGTLAYAYHGRWTDSGGSTRQDLRLLMPARGAFSRPLAWRMRAEGGDTTTSELQVVTSTGTEQAELVSGGVTTPLTLDADGHASASLAPTVAGSIRAYDGAGSLIGETAVPPFENSSAGVPGAQRGTRLVD